MAVAAACAVTVMGIRTGVAATTLGVGDLQVIGVTADADDSFTFVLWKDIDNTTVIRFMDQSFTNATTGLLGTENDMSLSFTAALSAGTVVRVVDSATTLVNGGAFTGSKTGSLSGISASGDQVFAYQGTAVGSSTNFGSRTLLYGFNIADTNWVTSGADSNSSFLPNAINSLDANVDSANFDNADYAGARTGMTVAAYRAAVANLTNFTQNDTRFDLATGGFTSTASVNLTWDNNGTTAGTGGTGTWDTTTQSKFSNSANTTFLHWVNSSTGNDQTAVFAGTAGTVSVAASGVTASGLTFNVTGYTVQNNTITLAGATPTISVANATAATVNSALAGSAGLTKSGAGTLALGGLNNYTGNTLVQQGTLLANNATSSTGSGNVLVGGGTTAATLGGAGRVAGNVTLTEATDSATTNLRKATLAPGQPGVSNGVGTLTVASGKKVTFEHKSTYEWEIATAGTGSASASSIAAGSAATAGGSYDQLDVSGGTLEVTAGDTVTITLKAVGSFALASNTFYRWRIALANTVTATIPQFVLDTTGITFANDSRFSIDAFSGGSGGVYVNYNVAVPEPGSLAVVAAGATLILLRRRPRGDNQERS